MEVLEMLNIPYYKLGYKIHITEKNNEKPTLVKHVIFANNLIKHQKEGLITKNQSGGKTPSKNWDNTLVGKLINYSENPDSVGWDATNRRWYAPTSSKYDKNQFGMGVDRNKTPGFKDKVLYDENGRAYLTEEDERLLRHLAIDAANESANARYKYAQKATKTKGSVSPKHDALTISAIYNQGATKVANTIYENYNAMKALFNRNSSDYQNYIQLLYKKSGLKDRIKRENEFFKQH